MAGKSRNPTDLAVPNSQILQAGLVYATSEILELLERNKPALVATDAPLSLLKSGFTRKKDRERIRNGYKVLPPNSPHMRVRVTCDKIE